jgi:hypothetical protein
MNLLQVARKLEERLVSLFHRNGEGIPALPELSRMEPQELWSEHLLFHEYFHADTGRGLGASHQTGWTALVARCLEDLAAQR